MNAENKVLWKKVRSNHHWFNKSFSGFLFPIAVQAMGITQGPNVSPYALTFALSFQNHQRQEQFDWFWDEGEMEEKREKILNATKMNPSFTKNFYRVWKKTYDECISYWKKIANTNFEDLTVDQIREVLLPLYQKEIKQASYGYVIDTFLTSAEEDWLEKEIRQELGERATTEIIAALTAPVVETFVNEFEREKLKIALMISKRVKEKVIFQACEKAAKNFSWIKTNYHIAPALTPQEIKEEALRESHNYGSRLSKRIKMEKTRVKENKKKKAALRQKLNLSENLQRVLEIAEIFTAIQDKRKELVLRVNFLLFRALKAVAEKGKIEDKLIYYLMPDEFFEKSKFQRVNWQEIKERRDQGALMILDSGQYYIVPKSIYEKEIALENFFQISASTEVKGAVAYQGKVRGIARVVRNVHEISKFGVGEILIANQTTPEFIPAMKKALAFVTDQGGITCHAAIVAREMKKPCVIGTKIATKIFKEGDVVEVDATRGIVRKIK